ncbi:ABC transporter ATP-binding protein [Azospirillum sp. SYSU D00513]|uniref:ABC transporter ATP-binding protein n=1 Tax=Azospirillum sp. SYSU D00513 TaxID=2812561 RepID=UPI001A96A772|nr:ABC transporter ATP-binding protein [Azospirillum sp. SYSU D00513]
MARIELNNLGHSYTPNPARDEDYALKPMQHVWEQGGAYALLGPSGCGKTTLLNIISGLLTPSQGRVLFDGKDVTSLPTEARNIAQVFQFPVVYDTMTVYENLAFPLRNRGLRGPAVDARVREIAELLDLTPDLNRRGRGLTADAKQKISLGRGLVRPDVAAILFDEPLTVIDPHLKWELRSKLKALHRALDLTMIYVTHDQTEALTFADKVVVMHDGRVLQIGRPEELFERPAHTFVGHFIGSPGMNVLPAELSGRHARVGGHTVALARGYRPISGGAAVEIGVRPEFTTLAPAGAGVPVRVRRIDDLGRLRIARVELAGLPLSATVPDGLEPAGEEASVLFEPAMIHVYADGALVEGAFLEGEAA